MPTGSHHRSAANSSFPSWVLLSAARALHVGGGESRRRRQGRHRRRRRRRFVYLFGEAIAGGRTPRFVVAIVPPADVRLPTAHVPPPSSPVCYARPFSTRDLAVLGSPHAASVRRCSALVLPTQDCSVRPSYVFVRIACVVKTDRTNHRRRYIGGKYTIPVFFFFCFNVYPAAVIS